MTIKTKRSSEISEIPSLTSSLWNNYYKLDTLDLSNNLLDRIESSTFQGLEDRLVKLDLSKNVLSKLNWQAFDNLNRLRELDVSYSQMSAITSWPQNPANQLAQVGLLGFNNSFFGTKYICFFETLTNLSTTLLQLDPSFECDCFLFYVYRNYRKVNIMKLVASKIPKCYASLIENATAIQAEEDKCNFGQILESCSRSQSTQQPPIELTSLAQPKSSSSSESELASSSMPMEGDSSPSSQSKAGEFMTTTCYTESTQPGLTTITIGTFFFY